MRFAVVSCVPLLAFPSACETQAHCDAIFIATPVITVTNAVTGATICDATVGVLGDLGGFPEDAATYEPSGIFQDSTDDGGCAYDGLALSNSSVTNPATVQVSKSGFQTVIVSDVHANLAGCGSPDYPPTSQHINVTLKPTP